MSDAKSLVSARREEAKKMLRRLIQHAAFANRKAEEELHKLLVQTRMTSLKSIVKETNSRLNSTEESEKGVVFKSKLGTTSSAVHQIDTTSQSQQTNDWYNHIWTVLDPVNGRDYSNDEGEDERLKSIRTSIILRMKSILDHSMISNRPIHDNAEASTDSQNESTIARAQCEEDCKIPLFQSMIGHCYDRLEFDDKALEFYAQGSFADAKVIMTLVTKKFLTVYPALNLKDWKSTKSSVPLLSRAGIVFDRQDLLFLSTYNILDTFLFGQAPDSMSSGSFVDSDTVESSSQASSMTMFSPMRDRAPTVVSEQTKRPTLDILTFLKWAFSLGDLVGLQAYRLISELIHQFLSQELATLLEVDVMCLQELDPSFHLGLHKSVSSFANSASLARLDAATSTANSTMRPKRRSSGGVSTSPGAAGSQKQSASTDGVLNDRVVYSETVGSTAPCELSVTLAVRVRELLRSSFIKTDRQNKVQVGETIFTSLSVTADLFSTLLPSSAFAEFELETCKLQAVDLKGLSTNALTMFFCNVYNTLVVHGVIVNAGKGAPGSALYERNNFLKNFKYNIGGLLYSALDVRTLQLL